MAKHFLLCESFAARSRRIGRCNGFDALRLLLATGIAAFHGFTVARGGVAGMPEPMQAAARLILPAFFVMSGYLVATSLARASGTGHFLLLRALRILPALVLVVSASALMLGPLMTSHPLPAYFHDDLFLRYFKNLFALPQYYLPGVFGGNPRPGVVNGALWTIPLELICYAALALAAFARFWMPLLAGTAALFLASPWAAALPAHQLFAAFATGVVAFSLARHVPHHPLAGTLSLAAAFFLACDPDRTVLVAFPLAYGVPWLGLHRLRPTLSADYSYGIYLSAYPVEQCVVAIFPGMSWWRDFAIAAPLVLFCAALLWHGAEKPLLARKHAIAARLGNACRLSRRASGRQPLSPYAIRQTRPFWESAT